MSIHDLPQWAQDEVRRVLRGEARRLLQKHLAECRDEQGKFHYSPVPDVPDRETCDVCGGTFLRRPHDDA